MSEASPPEGGVGEPLRAERSLALEWFVARRYLSGGRGRGFLSLITLIAVGGVTVGVAALILVLGLMSGLQGELRTGFMGAEPHGMVVEVGQRLRMEDWQPVLARVREDPGVVAASPFVYTEVGLNAGDAGYSEGAGLRALPGDSAGRELGQLDDDLTTGTLPFAATESGRPGIMVGTRLADRLGLYPGKTVTLVSAQNAELTPTGLVPQLRRFEVTGIFETGLFQYDSKFTVAEMSAVQDFLGMGSAVTGVGFKVSDPWRVGEVTDRLTEALGYPYVVQNWQTRNEDLFSALKLEKLGMAIVLFLIVLVAAMNIVSTLVMVVTDKTREIGILRSMGIPEAGVRRIFVLQGTVIGLVGTALGALLGGGIAWLQDRYQLVSIPPDVYYVDHLPLALTPTDVGLILGGSVLIAFLATIYPSWRAAKLTPVQAIRHE